MIVMEPDERIRYLLYSRYWETGKFIHVQFLILYRAPILL